MLFENKDVRASPSSRPKHAGPEALSDMTERRADQPIRKQGPARSLGADARCKVGEGLP